MLERQESDSAKPTRRWRSGNPVLAHVNWYYVIILLFALIVHGLLLFNDGVYLDGWLIYTYLIERDWNSIFVTFSEAGSPIAACFHWLLGYFPGVISGYKLVAWLSIFLAGILVYKICDESKLIGRPESLLIALISLSYPAFQVSIELIAIPSVFLYSAFLLAAFLAIRSEKASGVIHYVLRICSLVAFFLSFIVNSFLAFYFGFLLFLLIYAQRLQRLSLKRAFTSFLPRRLDFVLLPFLYWGLKQCFFPTYGLYADYNKFILSPFHFVLHSIRFLNNAVYGQLNNALLKPALLLLILPAIWWVYSAFKLGSARLFDTRVNSYALLVFGLVLLVLGFFPYAVVARSPSLHGWDTRHALLVALPMAVIIIAIIRLAFVDSVGSISRLGLVLLITLVLAFSLSTIKNYISWQARWVKDRSLMVNLGRLDNTQGISVFWVDDQFPAGGEDNYRFFEWSSIFKSVWGDESRIGLDLRKYPAEFLVDGQRYFNKRYNLSDFDPAGRQATLTIRRGRPYGSYSDEELSARYLLYKFFGKGKLAKFLLGVTDVQVQPMSAPRAMDHPAQ